MLPLTISCLSLHSSLCLSASSPVSPSVCLCLCVSWSLMVFLHLPVSLSLAPLCLPVCLSTFPGDQAKHSLMTRSLFLLFLSFFRCT